MQENDIELEAKKMWKKPEVREEFCNDLDVLIAYLQNQDRVKSHKGGYKTDTKKDAPKVRNVVDDSALKKWENSKSLQDEFGDFETFKAYQLNKTRVRFFA